jgi:AraC family transcriptional regulator
MTERIEKINEKKLVGKRMTMSHVDYRIRELWSSFMPRKKEINNSLSNNLFSLVIYPSTHFLDYKPTNNFEKWAAVEVESFKDVPAGLETYILPGGLYAVFNYRGTSSEAAAYFQNIYNVWLPALDYKLDDRPHFEILGTKYKTNDPSSEEEIWIPVKRNNK